MTFTLKGELSQYDNFTGDIEKMHWDKFDETVDQFIYFFLKASFSYWRNNQLYESLLTGINQDILIRFCEVVQGNIGQNSWEFVKMMCFPDNTKSPSFADKNKIVNKFILTVLYYLRAEFQFYQYITYENVFTNLFATTETFEDFQTSIQQTDQTTIMFMYGIIGKVGQLFLDFFHSFYDKPYTEQQKKIYQALKCKFIT